MLYCDQDVGTEARLAIVEQATQTGHRSSRHRRNAYSDPCARLAFFCAEHTGQDELTLLSQALDLGLGVLYRQAVEQAFIDETLARRRSSASLGCCSEWPISSMQSKLLLRTVVRLGMQTRDASAALSMT